MNIYIKQPTPKKRKTNIHNKNMIICDTFPLNLKVKAY